MKIFRDLIYIMQALMKSDHKFYKEHGIYDFPQKQKKRILQMKLLGELISIPSVQKKTKNQMSQAIIAPYQKVIENEQSLIVEGCYIPFDWKASFSAAEQAQIHYRCLVFSEEYIRHHFQDIIAFVNAVEHRLDDSACTME